MILTLNLPGAWIFSIPSVSVVLITDWRGTGCPSERANWKDQAPVGAPGQRTLRFWLRESEPRFWKPWISGLPQRRQQMKTDLIFLKDNTLVPFSYPLGRFAASTMTKLDNFLRYSSSLSLSLSHFRYCIVEQEDVLLLLWHSEGESKTEESLNTSANEQT